MKHSARYLLLLLSALLSTTGCASENAEADEILIGEFGALTGTTATFGQATRQGIDLAVEEINASGGLLGKRVRVIVEDDQGRPEEAQVVVTKLITRDRVVAVLGESSSSRTLAAAPVAQQNGIPLITPSATNVQVTQVGDFIFRVCFIDPFQGLVMAKFASNTLGVRNVAILRDIRNDYSVGLADVFIENFEALGGTILIDQSYSEGDTDFSAQLTALAATNPDAIFVPGYYTEVGLIARQARQLGINVPLLGGDGWDSPSLVEIAGASIGEAYFSNHYTADDPNPRIQEFVTNYEARFGRVPDSLIAMGYDAAHILFDAIRRAGSTDPQAIRDALAETRDYPGVTGNITIDEDRNAVKAAVILKVEEAGFRYVETVEP